MSAQSPTPQQAQRPRSRIESLTDLIFGLALSIGALGLINNRPGDAQTLLANVLFFGFGFLILISIWLRYTEMMSVLPVETGRTRNLNVLLLFLVALEPYMFSLIPGTVGTTVTGTTAVLSKDAGSVAYAIDIGAIYAILATFNHIIATKQQNLVAPELIPKYRIVRNLQILTAMIFVVSVLPPFSITVLTIGTQGVPVRWLFWTLTFVFSRGTWILKRMGRL